MIEYLRFFFGTRARAITSSIVFTAIVLVVNLRPELITETIERLISTILIGIFTAITPLIQPIMVVIIMIVGIRVIIGKSPGKKK